MRKKWLERSMQLLHDSLHPVAQELNELDWKGELSDKTDKLAKQACYQHCCLLYEDNKVMNNAAVRERFGIDKNRPSVASRIIADTCGSGLIKVADESVASTKFVSYIPYYG